MALSQAEKDLINKLLNKLVNDYTPKNIIKDKYYEANTTVKSLNTSINQKQATLNTVSGWGRTVVNTKSSRVRIQSFDTASIPELDKVVKENRLIQKSGELHKDCFIYGTGYMLVGRGDTRIGEPEILVTMESPYLSIGTDNPRTGRLDNFLKIFVSDGLITQGVLYTLNDMIWFNVNNPEQGVVYFEPVETYRETHNSGYVPAVRIANGVRTSNRKGESEISKSIRYFIDAINRTYCDLEWNNNFYAFPKRFVSGVNLERYLNPDGTVNHQALSSFMKDVWLFSEEESSDGTKTSHPTVGQLTASSSEPYIAVIKQLSAEIVREKFIPEYYLNAGSDIPTAAEAMQASEHPLNLVVSEIQSDFSNAYVDMLRIVCLMKFGSVPDGFEDVDVIWKDTSTISLAARTDALAKLIKSGAIPATSPVILTFIPWTESQRKIIEQYQSGDSIENRSSLAAAIRQMGSQLTATDPVVAESVSVVTGE